MPFFKKQQNSVIHLLENNHYIAKYQYVAINMRSKHKDVSKTRSRLIFRGDMNQMRNYPHFNTD